MEIAKIYDTVQETLIMEHLYTIDEYATFKIFVKSSGFSGFCNFCIALVYLKNVDVQIKDLLNGHKSNIEIKDCDSDAYIVFEFIDDSHVVIRGQIGGTHQNHYLHFNFIADQTVLSRLRACIHEVIE
jgi:hypothetical protein